MLDRLTRNADDPKNRKKNYKSDSTSNKHSEQTLYGIESQKKLTGQTIIKPDKHP